jgi:hypothetical protein
MTAIHVHRGKTEYLVVRTIGDRAAPESITCGSREELTAVLLLLGVADAGVGDIFDQLEHSVVGVVRI